MKRILALGLCLTLLVPAALAETNAKSPIGSAVESFLMPFTEYDPDDISLEFLNEEAAVNAAEAEEAAKSEEAAEPEETVEPEEIAESEETAEPEDIAEPEETAQPEEAETVENVPENEAAEPETDEIPDASAYETLKKCAKGDAVTRVQQRLTDLGIMTGRIDGDYGSVTAKAIKSYLAWVGESGNGNSISPEQQLRLLDPAQSCYSVDYAQDDRGDGVLYVERMLIAHNCLDLSEDTDYTDDTAEAVKVFQKTNGLPVTGIVDKATLDLLTGGKAVHAERPALVSVKKGSKGTVVYSMQKDLIRLGFLKGTGSGTFDNDTVNALKKAARYIEGLDKTGATCSAEGQQMLEDAGPLYVADVSKGKSGEETRRVEYRLNSLGYTSRARADGKFAQSSVDDIRTFQRVNGLEETGVADEKTQTVLFSADAKVYPSKYRVIVSIADQTVYVYWRHPNGQYGLVREMVCSTGTGDKTPTGVFVESPAKGEVWHHFHKYGCWAQYTYRIEGDILFHSVLFSRPDEKYCYQYSVVALGKKASHGCVRLAVEDAKFLYEHLTPDSVIEIHEMTGRE